MNPIFSINDNGHRLACGGNRSASYKHDADADRYGSRRGMVGCRCAAANGCYTGALIDEGTFATVSNSEHRAAILAAHPSTAR